MHFSKAILYGNLAVFHQVRIDSHAQELESISELYPIGQKPSQLAAYMPLMCDNRECREYEDRSGNDDQVQRYVEFTPQPTVIRKVGVSPGKTSGAAQDQGSQNNPRDHREFSNSC